MLVYLKYKIFTDKRLIYTMSNHKIRTIDNLSLQEFIQMN
jgi:hypothetical protein